MIHVIKISLTAFEDFAIYFVLVRITMAIFRCNGHIPQIQNRSNFIQRSMGTRITNDELDFA